MTTNPIIFYLASFFIIIFAIMTLFSKKVVNSLLCAVMVFFFGALFFFMLGSEYNAIIQAAIYGFAVPVIIGVSIMFGSNKDEKPNHSILSYISVLSVAIFVLAFVYLIMMSLAIIPDTFHLMNVAQVNAYDVMRTFARQIFVNYVWAFELVSLLLLIVIVGIGLMKKRGI